MYKTKDSRFVAFVLLQADRFWSDFCTRLGRTDLIDDERYATAAVRFQNRAECIARMKRCLSEMVVGGIETTIPLFQDLLVQPEIVAGDYDIHWLEQWIKAEG